MGEGIWHSARIRDWHSAVPGTLRIKKIKGHPGLRILVGKTEASGPMRVFSWRFRRDRFSVEAAQAWTEKHGYAIRRMIEASADAEQPAQKGLSEAALLAFARGYWAGSR